LPSNFPKSYSKYEADHNIDNVKTLQVKIM